MSSDDFVKPTPSRPIQTLIGLAWAILFTSAVCFALWYAFGEPNCSATALFRVSSQQWSLYDGDRGRLEPHEFEILQKTQVALVKSYFVLQSAIRDPDIASLSLLAGKADPVKWLSENIEAQFPKNSEILEIRLRGDEHFQEDLRRIVDAVADSYENEVVYAERGRQLVVRDGMARALANLENDLNSKMQKLFDIKAKTNATDSVDVALRQRELDVQTELARDLRRRLAIIDINAEAPAEMARTQKLHQAVISCD